MTWGCFTNIPQVLQNIISKFVYYISRTSYENLKLNLCTFEIVLESSRNISETTPRLPELAGHQQSSYWTNIRGVGPDDWAQYYQQPVPT